MCTKHTGLLPLLAILLTACSSSEPSPSETTETAEVVAPADPNAGPEYRRIHAALGNSFKEALSEGYGLGAVSAQTSRVLQQRQPLLDELIVTSRIERCDFSTDYTQGLATLMPQLAEMRGMAKLLDADAYRLTAEMQRDAAAERLAAIVRMARHATGEHRTLIEQLVGFALLNLACKTTDALLDRSLMDGAGRQLVARELGKVNPDDPLGGRAALRGERDMIINAIETGAGMDVAHGYAWPLLTDAQKEQGVDDVRAAFSEAEQVWDRPTAVADTRRIQEDLASGKITDHMVAKLTVPDLARYREQADRVARNVRETLARLER